MKAAQRDIHRSQVYPFWRKEFLHIRLDGQPVRVLGSARIAINNNSSKRTVFRNIIAHGNEISVEHRETIGFEMTDKTMYGSAPIWRYQKREFYSCCAVFLLCAVLKRILMNPADMKVVGTSSWNKHLDSAVR